MQTIDHYIHIGRDPDEQPKLEQSIQNRIIDILDNRKAVVNFVDTANDNLERDITQKIKIFHSLKTYVYGLASIIQYPMLNIGFKQNIIETASNCPDIDEIPIEIRDFCQSEIRNHPQWVEAQSYSEIEDVIDQFNKIQEVTQDFFQHHFLGICKKAIKEFEGQDLYRPQGQLPERNKRRRDVLVKFAKNMLGDNRVFFSTMNNGDLNSFLVLRKVSNSSYDDFMSQNTGKILEFGGAEKHLYDLEYSQYRNRIKRTSYQLKSMMNLDCRENILKKIYNKFGLTKKHICGGEYYGQCIQAYGEILKMSGVSNRDILYDASISLLPPEKR